ncbi:hypothetical protein [Pusillimonas sp. NJUB218]|uniref:hypothetical protein n=1 Tax=Pusillimonas sp. NJUB218 TaxID=2023230 RepID=UPI000F4BE21F|nr:hypothetical protein [Pusillimonas sp. NJUB218]ROT46673.1 hypothetical protein CHR62_01745 [Pusillimonas sp. NJUB218]
MTYGKLIRSTAAVLALGFVLAGCQEKEGPAERAGKELDKAAASVGSAIENAGQKVQDAAK